MQKTTFHISQMDCPSEEQLIRMKLEGLDDIRSLEFDIPNRLLHVVHTGSELPVFQQLDTLKLGTSVLSSVPADPASDTGDHTAERKALWMVLAINFAFFMIEITTGFISRSMGLVADSLDMLADSFVYALALFAVGGTLVRKKNIARLTGYFQLLLALLGFAEVIRRFIGAEEMPDFRIMVVVSLAALAANAACLYILQRSKNREVHMRATMICTSNDIIMNAGVIVAGVLVHWLDSGYPDLIVGAIVFLIVARGAYRILQISQK